MNDPDKKKKKIKHKPRLLIFTKLSYGEYIALQYN